MRKEVVAITMAFDPEPSAGTLALNLSCRPVAHNHSRTQASVNVIRRKAGGIVELAGLQTRPADPRQCQRRANSLSLRWNGDVINAAENLGDVGIDIPGHHDGPVHLAEIRRQ